MPGQLWRWLAMEAITFGPAVVHGFADAMMLLMMVMITEIERQDSSSRTAR